jgi:predicted porin
MNKKVMAVAVAGALAAPGVALAQTTIYGKLNAQYGFVSQMDDDAKGAGRESADGFNSGASYVGVRGEEKLGGGNSVWYQCETRARWGVDANPSQGTSGICDRNSAVGIKGGFGNFFWGRWDTAIETISGTTRIVDSTGWHGVQHMLTEDQSGFISFAQRPQNQFNYESPDWSGFTIGASFTSSGAALNNPATVSGLKGRIYSAYAKYAAGPLAAYVGYEKHDDNQTIAAGPGGQVQPGAAEGFGEGLDENMVTFGLSYVLGPVKLGIVYTTFEGDVTSALTLERDSWQIAGDWKITPAGTIRFSYTEAGEYEGSAVSGFKDSGAKQYNIAYVHALSKRSTAAIGYVVVDNDTNGQYNFHSYTDNVKPGDKGSAFTLNFVHTF